MKLGLKLNRSDDLVEQYYHGPKERNQKVVFWSFGEQDLNRLCLLS